MVVIVLEELKGKTAREVAFEIVSKIIPHKAEVRSLNDGKTLVVVADNDVYIDKLGKVVEANGVKVIAYKMGEGVYHIDISDKDNEIHIVTAKPYRVMEYGQTGKTASMVKEELDNYIGVSVGPGLNVIAKYKSNVEEIPLTYYELEREGPNGKFRAVVRFNEKSGVMTIETWNERSENVLTFLAF